MQSPSGQGLLRPGFLVMAAGQSERFGDQCKLSSQLIGGKSLLEITLSAITAVSTQVAVVCSGRNRETDNILGHLGIRSIPFTEQSPGLGDSIAKGVRATEDWDGWVICLADMPFISVQVYRKVFQLASSHGIVAPTYQGTRGHPVYFSAQYFNRLANLKGDKGAGQLLQEYANALHVFETDCRGITHDIDRPTDLPAG